MKSGTFILFVILMCSVYGQAILETPTFLKGDSEDQKEALQFYNEACELYEKGQIGRTKKSLQEAINTSFALTEAQIFLGKVYYEEGNVDSALYYYFGGLDFLPEQKPHVFFYLFELGFKTEEYWRVKHCMKHFEKNYKQLVAGKYEEEYPFDKNDFERFKASIHVVYDYVNWEPKSYIVDTLHNNYSCYAAAKNNSLFAVDERGAFNFKLNQSKKKKKSKLKTDGLKYIFLSKDEKFALISIQSKNGEEIFITKKKGSKWTQPERLPDNVNEGPNNTDCFYNDDQKALYFSSNRNGQYDLFTVLYNPETNKCGEVYPLSDINSKYDERNPEFYNKKFYFSSNGYPGFGGFDLYYTPDYQIINDIIFPSSVLNMGKPYNSGSDDISITFTDKGEHLVYRNHYKLGPVIMRMRFLAPEPQIDYDMRIIPLVEVQDD